MEDPGIKNSDSLSSRISVCSRSGTSDGVCRIYWSGELVGDCSLVRCDSMIGDPVNHGVEVTSRSSSTELSKVHPILSVTSISMETALDKVGLYSPVCDGSNSTEELWCRPPTL